LPLFVTHAEKRFCQAFHFAAEKNNTFFRGRKEQGCQIILGTTYQKRNNIPNNH
jgi:hypothetical protein